MLYRCTNLRSSPILDVEFFSIPLIDFLLPGSHFTHLNPLSSTRRFRYAVNDARIPS